MLVNESVFDQCIAKLDHVPFEQSQGWRRYQKSKGFEHLFFVDNEEQPNMACCGRIFKKPLIGKILDITGEVKKDAVSEKTMRGFYKGLIEASGCDMITYNSNAVYAIDMEVALRRAGFNRPLGSRTCPLTIFVDLANDNERKRDRNWKRNAKKAVEGNLVFKGVEKPTKEDVSVFCKMFEEMSATKHLGYQLEPESLYHLTTSPDYRLYFVYREDRPICARIVYLNNGMAADVFAANSNESREHSATHFMMDSLFKELGAMGAVHFDFSRIPPSNNETDSVYEFKKASGGDEIQYLGEWIWSKKRLTPLFFSIYNFYLRKAHHY